jgi:hypothetical protein
VGSGTAAVTFSGIQDSAGNTVPDNTLVAVTVAGGNVMDPATGQFIASVGGTITNGTLSPNTTYRFLTVTNGSITVQYSAAGATTGTARVIILPAQPNGNPIGNKALFGGQWPMTIAPLQ